MAREPDRLAIVTGGARGLGRHLCERRAERGYAVLVNYLSSEAAAADLAAGIRAAGGAAWTCRADVGRPAEVDALFAAADATGLPLGLTVNNVGIYDPLPLREIGLAEWQRTIAVNLNGAFQVCRASVVRMSQRTGRGGQIVNIGVAGNQLNQAEGFATDYYISKAALLQLTRALAAEYAPDGIRLNMVSPGQLENSIGEVGGAPGGVPIGRDGTFEDVWQAIAYLLGADYVTGANIEVSGGYRL